MARYKSPKHRVITSASEVKRKRITHAKVSKIRDKLSKKQAYVCPICTRDLRKLTETLDHCHTTGYVRGVLCNNCNGLEGKLSGLIKRLDIAGIGFDAIIQNLAYHRHPSNRKKKWIHPNAETLVEQKLRQKKRAKTLYQAKRKASAK